MSVYRREGQTHFSYDFTIRGHRFSGACGTTHKREAEAAEKAAREQAKLAVIEMARVEAAGPQTGPKRMTLRGAIDRYWDEHAKFLEKADDVILTPLNWIAAFLVETTMLDAIENEKVAAMVAARRATTRKGKGGQQVRVQNSTVNRYGIELLRRLMYHARDAWSVEISRIKWKKHKLPERDERVRSASATEEATLHHTLTDDYARLLEFAVISGCRQRECLVEWSNIDWGNRIIRVRGKGDKILEKKLTGAVRDIIWPLQGNHPVYVFTFVNKAGEREPITQSGLASAYRRARDKAGVVDLRFHDLRHTYATRLLRETGNLKLVQLAIGHSNLKTTSKYAHVLDDEVRAGLEAMEAKRPQKAAAIEPKEATG